MKHQLYAIAMMILSSIPSFGQVPNSASLTSAGTGHPPFSRSATEENSLILQKGDDGGFVAGITLSITPNPTAGNTHLILTTELPIQAQIRLLDAGGNLIKIVATIQLSSGTNHVPGNFNLLASGIYYIQVITAGDAVLKKMIVT